MVLWFDDPELADQQQEFFDALAASALPLWLRRASGARASQRLLSLIAAGEDKSPEETQALRRSGRQLRLRSGDAVVVYGAEDVEDGTEATVVTCCPSNTHRWTVRLWTAEERMVPVPSSQVFAPRSFVAEAQISDRFAYGDRVMVAEQVGTIARYSKGYVLACEEKVRVALDAQGAVELDAGQICPLNDYEVVPGLRVGDEVQALEDMKGSDGVVWVHRGTVGRVALMSAPPNRVAVDFEYTTDEWRMRRAEGQRCIFVGINQVRRVVMTELPGGFRQGARICAVQDLASGGVVYVQRGTPGYVMGGRSGRLSCTFRAYTEEWMQRPDNSLDTLQVMPHEVAIDPSFLPSESGLPAVEANGDSVET
eukprot:CAMPEP_0204372714 /NCGR_PEP_ID=MMETSP0469-20131031/47494_1 /ASSEMBLY_ACC=CAM_ASM_000384 /TAXON_ID=2969 /ORGANISM="Oxyrrhis marina" /LENGTH=366 /DNA_ID=CAMNT_0051363059 /DNA_START=38 /DNA_END=1138 /DNA_ORIENTATION=-